MSKYTTEIRYICETESGLTESVGYNDFERIIGIARPKIFDFAYPIFDPNYKTVLEPKILKHFYTREIGFETVGLWKLNLNRKLNEIMPFYNQLYESELLMNGINPFNDVDYYRKKDITGRNKNNGNIQDEGRSTANSTDENSVEHENTKTLNLTDKDKYSDTPQGGLNGLESDNYLTNARIVTHTGTEKNEGSESGTNTYAGTGTTYNNRSIDTLLNTTEDYLEHVYGKMNMISYAKLLKELRDTFLNIDMRVINELEILFMGLW